VLLSLRDMQSDYRLRAEDGGEFGEISGFLINAQSWSVRYLVVEVGSREVLLSTRALGQPDRVQQVLPITVSREKVMNSPDIDTSKHLTREMERKVYDFYEWPYDWDPNEVPETLPGDLTAVPLIEMELEREEQLVPQTGGRNQPGVNLFNSEDLLGYNVYASNDDRNSGRLHDFFVDSRQWNLRYMVIDTSGLFPGGKKVALAPSWIEAIDEKNSRVIVNLKEETIKNTPEFRSLDELDE
jgi:hypothetical protein